MNPLLKIKRKTAETDIVLSLRLAGKGRNKIETPVGFFNHMLELFSFHSKVDLFLRAQGDIEVDNHHLIEDIGLVLGEALNKALRDRRGINRYGQVLLPMDEALSYITLDLSGRPFLYYKVKFSPGGNFDYSLLEDFFRALVNRAGMTLHIELKHGRSNHHIAESIFKGLGRALQIALKKTDRKIPSTKGVVR